MRSQSFTEQYRDKAYTAENYQKLRESVSAEIQAEIENVHADAEKTFRALSDPDLSPKGAGWRVLKSLQAWPRIICRLSRAELEIAKKDRKARALRKMDRRSHQRLRIE